MLIQYYRESLVVKDSRSGRIIEINDVSKEEALQYLKLREIDEEQAAQIYELVGGSMIHLKSIADEIKSSGTLEDMRKTMFSTIRSQLKSAEILPERRYHKDGAKIIRELLKKGSISGMDQEAQLDSLSDGKHNSGHTA
jgi:hypothetical protein